MACRLRIVRQTGGEIIDRARYFGNSAANLTNQTTEQIMSTLLTTPKHKVFVSYHHSLDQDYREKFEALFAGRYEIMISKSVQMGDIDPNLKTDTIRQKIRDEYLRDSTVTVVLVGEKTWQRKHVDWEISASIRRTEYNPRSGLLGIILPVAFRLVIDLCNEQQFRNGGAYHDAKSSTGN
jgi:hypothetical protein